MEKRKKETVEENFIRTAQIIDNFIQNIGDFESGDCLSPN